MLHAIHSTATELCHWHEVICRSLLHLRYHSTYVYSLFDKQVQNNLISTLDYMKSFIYLLLICECLNCAWLFSLYSLVIQHYCLSVFIMMFFQFTTSSCNVYPQVCIMTLLSFSLYSLLILYRCLSVSVCHDIAGP